MPYTLGTPLEPTATVETLAVPAASILPTKEPAGSVAVSATPQASILPMLGPTAQLQLLDSP